MSAYHQPVMLRESVSALAVTPNGTYVDATFGGGGHSLAILEQLKVGHLYGFDRDADAMANSIQERRFTFIHSNFKYIQNCLRYFGCVSVDGIFADLGVSSHQFDTEERGFSFRFDSVLDMRMNQNGQLTASQVVNNYPEEELERIFRLYGEVPQSKRVASLIIQARKQKPVHRTQELVEILTPMVAQQHTHKFFATIFQALRMEVNGEMSALEALLEQSLVLLKSGGRLVVITYHSLEDRMVKNFMRSGNVNGHIVKDFYGNEQTPFVSVHRKAVTPSTEELVHNNRARSAKLRAVEKC